LRDKTRIINNNKNMDAASKAGLQLNTAKCEIIMEDFAETPTSSVLYSFVKVEKAEMTLPVQALSEALSLHFTPA